MSKKTGSGRHVTLSVRAFTGLGPGGEGRSEAELNIVPGKNGVLTPRPARARLTLGGKPLIIDGSPADAVCAGGELCLLTAAQLLRAGRRIFSPGSTEEPRRLIPFGSSFFILPDGLLVSGDGASVRRAGAVNVCAQAPVVTLSLRDGSSPVIEQESAAPADGSCRIFTGQDGTRRLMKWDSASTRWTDAGPVSVVVSCPGIGVSLRPGDGVVISGSGSADVNGAHILTGASDGTIVFDGLASPGTRKAGTTAARPFPMLENGIFFDERIWGSSPDGSAVIACKRSDPLNFAEVCGGVRVAVDTPGPFTASAVLGGRLFFLKEDGIYRIVKKTSSKNGSTVSAYSYEYIPARGPAASCRRAVAAAGGRLIWPAGAGLVVFDGSGCTAAGLAPDSARELPSPAQKVYEAAFGEPFVPADRAAAACAGESGSLLLFAAQNGAFLTVYDTASGETHITDAPSVVSFVDMNGSLIAVTEQDGGIGFTAMDGSDLPDPAALGGDGWQELGGPRWLAGIPLSERRPGRLTGVSAGVILPEGSFINVFAVAGEDKAVKFFSRTGPLRERAAGRAITAPSGGTAVYICGAGPAGITGLDCETTEEE